LTLVVVVSCDETRAPAASTKQSATAVGNAEVSTLGYEERQGKYIYLKYCAVCHGMEGKGDGFNAYNLDPKPRDFTDSTYMKTLNDARLIETISEGGRGVNKSPLMPMWGMTISRDNILDVVQYLRTLAKK
jgi:mono/diheme cytochrome c family protein